MTNFHFTSILTLIGCFTLINSEIPSTLPQTPNKCPGGNIVYQDIAILYELTYFPDNSTMEFSQQISNAISSKLFSGPAYQYFQADGKTRVTQITPLPFPSTATYNILADDNIYGKIKSQSDFEALLKVQLKHSQIGLLQHPTQSKISEGLNYLTAYIQGSKRPFPIQNTIIIIAKRDSDVNASQVYINSLKASGSKIMTITVGNGNISNFVAEIPRIMQILLILYSSTSIFLYKFCLYCNCIHSCVLTL